MRINNNQQQKTFKANTIVRFEKQVKNMEGFASLFASLEGHIGIGCTEKPFIIGDGKSVLVPDRDTDLGAMLMSVYTDARKNLKTFSKNAQTRANEALKNPLVKKFLAIIERDKDTVKAPYKEPFKPLSIVK